MVAPKNTGAKEKSDDKKTISSSPEPFQEPDGMTTIDLNKSDDYSKETEVEEAKLKQRAQIRYVSRLLFALCSILFVVLTLIAMAFLNKEYHLFTVKPPHINQTSSNRTHNPTPSPTKEFENLTRILNQGLFREKLKSGKYLENSDEEMNPCLQRQTLDTCCEVFKNTELHSLVEYCTVNDMLDILFEFELDRRKKRQVFGGKAQQVPNASPPPDLVVVPNDQLGREINPFDQMQWGQFGEPNLNIPGMIPFEDQLNGELNLFSQNQWNPSENIHNFEVSDLGNPGKIPHEDQLDKLKLFDPNQWNPSENINNFEVPGLNNLGMSSNEVLMSGPHLNDQLIRKINPFEQSQWSQADNFHNFEHLNNADPQAGEPIPFNQNQLRQAENSHHLGLHELNSQFPQEKNIDFKDEQQSHMQLQQDPKQRQSPDGQSDLQMEFPDQINGRIRQHFTGHPKNEEKFFQSEDSGSRLTQHQPIAETYARSQPIIIDEPRIKDGNSNVHTITVKANGNFKFTPSHNLNRYEFYPSKPSISSKMFQNTEFHMKHGEHEDFTLGVPQKNPLVSKFGSNVVQVRENSASNSDTHNPVNLEGSEDPSQLKVPPNLKITKIKDDLDVATMVLSDVRQANINIKPTRVLQNHEVPFVPVTVINDNQNFEAASDNNKELRESESLKERQHIFTENKYLVSTPNEGEELKLGVAQKKPLVSRFGSNVQIRQNKTSNSDNDDPANLEGSDDSAQIKVPPNLKVTKKKDDLDVTTMVLPKARQANADIQPTKAFQSNDVPVIPVTVINDHQRFEMADDDNKELRESENHEEKQHIFNESDFSVPPPDEGEKLKLGVAQKKPLVTKYGSNVQIRQNKTSNSENDEPAILEGSDDSAQIKVPPNLKVTKKKDDLDVTTMVLPKARQANVDIQPTKAFQGNDVPVIPVTVINDHQRIELADVDNQELRESDNHDEKQRIFNEKGFLVPPPVEGEEPKLGVAQKKPLVTKFGSDVQVRQNKTSNSENDDPANLEGSEDSTQIKLPPNLKVTKNKDDLDVTTMVLPRARQANVDIQPTRTFQINNMPVIPDTVINDHQRFEMADDDSKELRESENHEEKEHIFHEKDFLVLPPDEGEELKLGVAQKKPLVTKFGSNVQVRQNKTSNSENDDPANLEGSDDSAQIKVPPNLKVTKNREDLDVTTMVLPGVRQANADIKPTRTFQGHAVSFIPVTLINDNNKELIESVSHGERQHILNEKDFLGSTPNEEEELRLGVAQKKPLVTKFGSNVQIRQNKTSNSENDDQANLEDSKDSTQIKVPPNLKVTKNKDDLDVTTMVLPRARQANVDIQPTRTFQINNMPVIPDTVINDHQRFEMAGDDSKELRESEDHEENQRIFNERDFLMPTPNEGEEPKLGVAQKKPLVTKYGSDIQIRQNMTSNSENDDPANLEGSDDSAQIKVPPNLKVTKNREDLDVTTMVLPGVRQANADIKPTKTFQGHAVSFIPVTLINDNNKELIESESHGERQHILNEKDFLGSTPNEEEELRLGVAQKKPLVTKFGSNVQIRQNKTSNSEYDDQANLEGSEDSTQVKVPPNLKVTKNKDDLDVTTMVLPRARQANVDIQPTRTFQINNMPVIPDTVINDHQRFEMAGDDSKELRESESHEEKEHIFHERDFLVPPPDEGEELKLRVAQKKPLVTKYGSNVQIRQNKTSNSENDDPANLEGSEESTQIKLPPNLKVTKNKHDLDVTTMVLPRARQANVDIQPTRTFQINNMPVIPDTVINDHQRFEMAGDDSKELRKSENHEEKEYIFHEKDFLVPPPDEGEELQLGVAQKKPLVTKFGSNVQVRQNKTSNSENDDPANLEGSDDSAQIKVPPNLKVTKNREDLDVTTMVLPGVRQANADIRPTRTFQGHDVSFIPVTLINDNNKELIESESHGERQHTLNEKDFLGSTPNEEEELRLGVAQKKPLVTKFGSNVQIRQNKTSNLDNDDRANLEGSDESAQIKTPPNLKVTKNKDDLDVTTMVLPRARQANVDIQPTRTFQINNMPVIPDTVINDHQRFEMADDDSKEPRESENHEEKEHIFHERDFLVPPPDEGEELKLGVAQKKPLVTKYGSNVQIRQNKTSNSENEDPANLEGSDDSAQIKVPPNLKVTKKKDDLDATTMVLPKVKQADVDIQPTKSFQCNDMPVIPVTVITDHQRFEMADDDNKELRESENHEEQQHILNERDFLVPPSDQGEELKLGVAQKKPLVTKYGSTVKIRQNRTSNSENDDPANLEGSEDSTQIKLPPNLKVTKKRDDLDVTTIVLPRARQANVDIQPTRTFQSDDMPVVPVTVINDHQRFEMADEDNKELRESENHEEQQHILNERDFLVPPSDQGEELKLGVAQKKPLVTKYGSNVQIRQNKTSNSENDNPANLEGSEDSTQIKLPPNLKVTKKRDDLDVTTIVLPRARQANVDIQPTRKFQSDDMPVVPVTVINDHQRFEMADEDNKELRESENHEEQQHILNERDFLVPPSDQGEELKLGVAQKKPLVTKYGSTVQIRQNRTSNSENDDPANLEGSEDSTQIKLPPNLKVTKKRDDLDVTTIVLPRARQANVDIQPTRTFQSDDMPVVPVTVINDHQRFEMADEDNKELRESENHEEQQHILNERDFLVPPSDQGEELKLGVAQKKPLVTKYGSNVQIRQNKTSNSENDDPANLEGSEDSTQIKLPPNLKVTKKRDDLDVTTIVLPRARQANVDIQPTRTFQSDDMPVVPVTVINDHQRFEMADEDNKELRESENHEEQQHILNERDFLVPPSDQGEELKLGVAQKKPLVTKYGSTVQIRQNRTSNSENDDPANLEGSEDSTQIKLPPNLKVTKKRDDLDVTTIVLPRARQANVDIQPTRTFQSDDMPVVPVTVINDHQRFEMADEDNKELRESENHEEQQHILNERDFLVPPSDQGEELKLGVAQKKPLVTKYGSTVQIRQNRTSNSENDDPANLEGSEDSTQIKLPPNLKVTKKRDDLYVTTIVLPRARQANVDIQPTRTFQSDDMPVVPVTVINDHQRFEMADEDNKELRESENHEEQQHILNERDFLVPPSDQGEELKLGVAQKKPLVTKYGSNVQIRQNKTSNSENDDPANLDGSEDSTQIKLPPNLKVTKNREDLDLTTMVLPGIRQANADIEPTRTFQGHGVSFIPVTVINDNNKELRGPESHGEGQDILNETDFLGSTPNEEELRLGVAQKKPLVTKFGSNVQIRQNNTSNSENDDPASLEGSEHSTQIKFPPNLKVTKNKDDLDVTTTVLPRTRQANVDIQPTRTFEGVDMPVVPVTVINGHERFEMANADNKELRETENHEEKQHFFNERDFLVPPSNEGEELKLGVAQKKPLVTTFGSNVQVRQNKTSNSEKDDPAHLEGSDDSAQIKVPPNLKVTKKKDDLDVTTMVLPVVRQANEDIEPTRTFYSHVVPYIPVTVINNNHNSKPARDIIQREPKDPEGNQEMLKEKDFLDSTHKEGEEFNDGIAQTQPLLSEFGSTIHIHRNSTSSSKSDDSIHLEGSEDELKIKVPPNLKIIKNKDDLDVTTMILPRIRETDSEEQRLDTQSQLNSESMDLDRIKSDLNIVPSKIVRNNIRLGSIRYPSSDLKINKPSMTPNVRPEMATTEDLTRSNGDQEDFRAKPKQLNSYTTSEDLQSNQQRFINPCFYPYMNPYVPFPQSPAKVGSAQDPGYLKIVTVSQPKVQNQPMFALNPAMYYGIPPQTPYPSFPPQPYLPPNYYPPMTQSSQNPMGLSHGAPVQVASPGGQYYLCNPIPTPTSNLVGLAGIEVRRDASNLQNLMAHMEEFMVNNKSREATLICPLGEHACLDNSKCIKNHHVCDSEIHCDDSSDEIACSCKERVGKLRVCDGYCDCPLCEDEQGCFGCEKNEFSCDDWSRFRRSTCIPLGQRCDGIKQCEITGKDEMDCSILADHIGTFPLNKISNSVGFLHRNYKGKWYPTCFGTELWAAQVCQIEAGPSAIIPKAHMTLTTDPYNGLFINILPNNEVSLVNTCVQDRAAFVECPPIYCGLRFLVNNPYRDQEVDTSVEDMLADLERAYKVREDEFERSHFDPDIDIGRMRAEYHSESDDGDIRNMRSVSAENVINDSHNEGEWFTDLRTKGNLTHEHLEEVIENLERTFRRSDISDDDRFSAPLKESRVVGGKPSQPAAWPWLVSIYKNGIFHCGGVLINELWVVTASHCVDRFWQYHYEIQAGALRRFSYAPMDQRRWAKVVVPHEFYSKSNLRNDIALMKLSAPVRYNRYVRPICLPSETTAGQDYLKGPSSGTICTTVGWGATVEHGADPDHMREVEVPILQHCKHREDSDVQEICAGLAEGGKDACQGDSGGPLMCRNPNNPNQWYLAGIVSHGEGCGRPQEPGVYTKVSRYMGWIAENTREDKFTITNPLQKCPGYICKGTKRCIAKKRRCDKIIDCLLGDDELDCENRFKDIFKHSRKHMLPSTSPIQSSGDVMADLVENLVPLDDIELVGSNMKSTTEDVAVHEEMAEYLEENDNTRLSEIEEKRVRGFEDIYFKCKILLQVIPIGKRCDKILDCEDGSDELDCSCADYIKTIDASAICDGVTDCTDASDENDCVRCNTTEYTCRLSQKCIDISKRCDGNADCPQNEDEMNCATLTNGHTLTIDKDNRPMFKSRGIVSINNQGEWKPLCLRNSPPHVNDEPSLATVICNLLGFDEYLTYHKYRTEDAAINSSYSMISGKISLDPENKKCDSCCDGLYISCSNTSTSSTLQYKSLEQVKELYFSPWTAAIYVNGQYRCMGTLLDEFWIVTSTKCLKGIQLLHSNYVVAVLGKGKLHISMKGPHEQVIRIGGRINVNNTDIVLLRLETDVKFNRYVQAADLNARREGLQKEKCYAMGQDNEDKVLFVPLMPLKNCLVGFRCFEKKIEEHCKGNHPWSGTIICDSRVGWYPAAVYHEEDGYCGFSHKKKYTSVKFYKNQIFKLLTYTPKSIPPSLCQGFQCPLGNCIPEKKVCDGISDCHNGDDERSTVCYEKEKECHLGDHCVCPPTHLKCSMTNKCYPKSAFCDRTDNCGDFEDEPNVCSCRNYLKLTNPGKICDGTLNCIDRSDEDPEICSCQLGDFQCGKLNKCISNEMVCDGTKDCPNGEDEATCLSLKTESDERSNAGEVMTRTAGIWHSGCFDLNYSTTQLEEMCMKLGFNGNSANQLTPPHNLTTLSASRPVLDSFDVVWLRRRPGNKLRLRLRSGHDPYVKFVTDRKCHRLFIACI